MTTIIMINKKSFELTSIHIEIDNLLYWPDNPRINSVVGSKSFGNSSEKQEFIQQILFERDRIRELKKQILQAGGLSEPLIVRSCGASGQFEVIEGNSRLAACRMIGADVKKLQCFLLPENITEDDIFSYLSALHLQGKLSWGAYENACFMRRESQKGRGINEIAEKTGHKAIEVTRHIQTTEFMDKVKEKKTDNFSYYKVVIDNQAANEALFKTGYSTHKDRLAEIIHEYTETSDAQTLRKHLRSASTSKKHFRKFLDGKIELKSAAEKAEQENDQLAIPKKLNEHLDWLKRNTKELKNTERIDTNFPTILQRLKKLNELSEDIVNHLEAKERAQ